MDSIKTGKGVFNTYQLAKKEIKSSFKYVGLFSFFVNLLMLTGPIFMLQVYDRVLSSGSYTTLAGLFVSVIFLYSFMMVFDFIRNKILSRVAYKFDIAVSLPAYKIWMTVHEPILKKVRPISDIATVRGFISSPLMGSIFDVPWIPAYLLLIFFFHPWLGFLTLAGAMVVVVLALANQYLTLDIAKKTGEMDAEESFFLAQCYKNINTLNSLRMIGAVSERWQVIRRNGLTHSQKNLEITSVFTSTSKTFRLFLQSALLGLGAYLALEQEITPGMIIAASIIAGRALAPIDQIIGQWRVLIKARLSNQALESVFQYEPLSNIDKVDLPTPNGQLSAKGLTKFSTQGGSRFATPVIDQVNFELYSGDGLGVIGPSTSGKTLLANLLVGAVEPDKGDVELDAVSLSQYKECSIGYLPQCIELLPGSIKDNICGFNNDAEDSDIIYAAKVAGVHTMITSMPDGYNTIVGNNDSVLSGGQIQRIAFARALYGDPQYIILDEPNSNLDMEGDLALSKAIIELRNKGKTVIVMTHRPSAIESVNKILILNKGRVVEFGEKNEVLNKISTPDSPVKAIES